MSEKKSMSINDSYLKGDRWEGCNKEGTVLYGLQFDSVLKILRTDLFTGEIFQSKRLQL